MYRFAKNYIKQKVARKLNGDEVDFSSYPVVHDKVDLGDMVSHDVVFLLTTGRSGTKTLIEYLKENSGYCAIHAPKPSLATLGSLLWKKKVSEDSAQWAYFSAREKYLYELCRRGVPLIDGDCKNLPLLPALSDFFPNSKFVHVVRNPLDFVISGLDRGYFVDKDPLLWGHLFLRDDESLALSFEEQVMLIADFWEIANRIAEITEEKVGGHRFLTLKSENMFKDSEEIAKTFSGLGYKSFKRIKNGPAPVLNRNLTSSSYDISLVKCIIKDRCPSAKRYYPEVLVS
ncbi:sulfotransferase [Halomonas urmiana]|uniref:Sulfotransferase n=1 Tax=Halomonas urmiana TaxID=490901 RepID=A0A5R8M7M9_9GAMM|nr:sulfotransferase [Halomonas urmiana]TLF45505.1 sulfotransferase [Halomonas urmiana]